MTITAHRRAPQAAEEPAGRFRLHRAGILNVWQYDDQEFLLGDGRMLLRGANGAGKSKTLEMLLPFTLDGDKARITASARHHTSLLWLMTDGYDGQARVGYLWVEFLRPTADGEEAFTCGVGIRASASAKTATAWFFTTNRRIGHDLSLEDAGGPLPRPKLEDAIGESGQVFVQAAAYKEHVGRQLFGLEVEQYDEVLRLLYWLRQPQVGEDIQPDRLAGQLAQALPQLDEQAVRAAGDTFDELASFGEQLRRRTAAAESLERLAAGYRRYARGIVATRAGALLEAAREERRRRTALRRQERALDELTEQRGRTEVELSEAQQAATHAEARIRELEASPEARDQRRLAELAELTAEREQLAAGAADRARDAAADHARRADRLTSLARELTGQVRQHGGRLRELETARRAAGIEVPIAVPPSPDADVLGGDDAPGGGTGAVTAALATAADSARAVDVSAGQRRAAVRVVGQALAAVDAARRQLETREQRAAEAEQRWEGSRARRLAAEGEVGAAEDELTEMLHAWVGEEDAVPVALPVALDADTLADLPAAVRSAAASPLTELRERAQSAAARRDRATELVGELAARREVILAETDPAPPAPALARRRPVDGAPLWRLVDFTDELDDQQRAGLEAALQASGLLDAWIRPDGAMLTAETRDSVLLPGEPVPGRTLADLLRPDPAPDSGVTGAVVGHILERVGLCDLPDVGDAEPTDGASVGVDGTWSLAPLHGRAHKDRAQYVGATARAEERRRRLDEVDERLDRSRQAFDEAAAELAELTARTQRVEAWLGRLPSAQRLLTARTRLEERRTTEVADEETNRGAQRAAHEGREHLTRAQTEALELAAQHDLPADRGELDVLEERLRALAAEAASVTQAVPVLTRELDRLREERADHAARVDRVDRLRAEATELQHAAESAACALAELRDSVGATVRRLEQRLTGLRTSVTAQHATARGCAERLRALDEQSGSVKTALERAAEDLAAQQHGRAAVLAALAAVAEVPGLLGTTAAGTDGTPESTGTGGRAVADTRTALLALAAVPTTEPVSADLLTLVERLAALGAIDADAEVNGLWRAYNEAVNGPAADHEPTVTEIGDLLAVTGRDDAGEAPVERLAERVSASVERDRTLLTERERSRFEQHVLGELGDAIRRCRLEAEELVEAMNRLLAGVTTSQGIRVRLDWKLRDDVPADAQEAVRLLAQPVGALLPEERARLRDALHRLIEASRAERPELSYGEHLAAALDYRAWFCFRIRYSRPESEGSWLALHRRSPLSQGEQKVLCYLPLFAAAAAHFTSLAGAAPHAPRLVLLDDAFPKIDVRTHPLLFGLLVQLDLDFVITSERLWGDHDTVPSLAIYEALRDPSQRGIAQYEYRWDGRQLRSLG